MHAAIPDDDRISLACAVDWVLATTSLLTTRRVLAENAGSPPQIPRLPGPSVWRRVALRD